MPPIPPNKKYCSYCNCWMANNKISIQNHELGDRHKAAIQRKIDSMRKNNVDTEKEKLNLEKSLLKMNDAATASMLKDIARDPSLAKRYGLNLSEEELQKLKHNQSTGSIHSSLEAENAAKIAALLAPGNKKELKAGLSTLNVHQIKWREVKHIDGRIYYWNKVTNETSWIRPDEAVESLSDLPVNVQAEKDRVNQFLFNRLIQLSESGVSGASEAVCQAFDASPNQIDQTAHDSEGEHFSHPAMSEPDVDEKNIEDPEHKTFDGHEFIRRLSSGEDDEQKVRKDTLLLGEWQPIIEEPQKALPKLELPFQNKKIHLKLKTQTVQTKEEAIAQQKADDICNLADLTYQSMYGKERFEIGEKVLPFTGVFPRKRKIMEDEQLKIKQEEHLQNILNEGRPDISKIQFFTKADSSLSKKEDISAPKVVFNKRNVSSAARNSRTTSFND